MPDPLDPCSTNPPLYLCAPQDATPTPTPTVKTQKDAAEAYDALICGGEQTSTLPYSPGKPVEIAKGADVEAMAAAMATNVKRVLSAPIDARAAEKANDECTAKKEEGVRDAKVLVGALLVGGITGLLSKSVDTALGAAGVGGLVGAIVPIDVDACDLAVPSGGVKETK